MRRGLAVLCVGWERSAAICCSPADVALTAEAGAAGVVVIQLLLQLERKGALHISIMKLHRGEAGRRICCCSKASLPSRVVVGCSDGYVETRRQRLLLLLRIWVHGRMRMDGMEVLLQG